ncbi:hypothetical protein WJ41_33965 [Burkholderia ubonensis]|uniref:hypothetical protein n=1 Tax=Burkholderia ubonensis TaxID=101571 RepID=UPI00075777D2|nr:hypothetical protein [Burkholderia ubonensis]KVH79001.1 hypothetical protein WJ41_33965 [Burkholderia ubonensis]KVU01414.1 hypothetical protein WK61_05250 [Burkholderia ubonensis]
MRPLKTAVRTKGDLLPIPAAERDRIALECYMALCTLRSGRGDCHTLTVLTHALVATHFLLEAGVSDDRERRATFDAAQDAINRCDSAAAVAGACAPASAAASDAIGGLLALYDRQLRLAPRATVAQVADRVDAYLGRSRDAAGETEQCAA